MVVEAVDRVRMVECDKFMGYTVTLSLKEGPKLNWWSIDPVVMTDIK